MPDLNLNPFLQPINAPVSSNEFTSGYEFDYQNERGAVGEMLIQSASITNAKIVTLDASKILAGTITVAINLGTASGGSIVLDGANKNITISDGTTNRVLLGYQSGGF